MPDVDPIISALLGVRQYPTDDPIAGIQPPLQTPKLGATVPPVNAAPQPNQVMSGVGDLTGVNDAVKALRGQMTPEEQQGFAATAAFGLIPGIGELRPVAKAAEELAPPLYSAAAKAIQDARLTKASPEQWLGYLRNQPGVKQDELGYMGALPSGPQVTKDEMQQWANANQVQLKEVTKGGSQEPDPYDFQQQASDDIRRRFPHLAADDESDDFRDRVMERANELSIDATPKDATKFGQYQLPGGQNYREMLMTLPPKDAPTADPYEARRRIVEGDTRDFTSSHWDEPNVIAHARMNDRVVPDAQGNPQKTLFLEELQSDWHQKGRQQGYATDMPTFLKNEGMTIGDDGTMTFRDGSSVNYGTRANAEQEAQRQMQGRTAVPDAPFKQTWPDLMLKRLVRHAAENGYDQLAWTPGDVQVDRYDLSKQVGNIGALRKADGTYLINATPKNGGTPIVLGGGAMPQEKIADYVGKDLADKIASQEGNATKIYEGGDLKVGGEGMRAFYDKMLVDKANAIGKKYGARVTQAPLTTEGTASFRPMTDLDFEAYSGAEPGSHIREANGTTQIRDPEGNVREIRATPDGDLTEHDLGKIKDEAVSNKIHVLPLTPELKRAALTKGFPMFATGGLAAGLSSGGQPTGQDPNQQMLQALRGPSAPGSAPTPPM